MTVSRRTLFAIMGAGLAAAASGCAVSDPRVSEPTGPRWTPTPTPTPTQIPQVQQALEREARLAALAGALIAGAGGRAAGVTAAQQAHLAHVEAFSTGFGPVATPSPTSPTPAADPSRAATDWAGELSATAGEHRAAAVATAGELGVLLASCAAFAGVLSGVAAGQFTVGEEERGEFVPVSDVDALVLLVGQLHAARFVYQTALGAFQLADERRDPLEVRESELTRLRDQLSEALVDRGVAPPPAEPAYEVARPADQAAAIALTSGIEERLLPFVGAGVAGVVANDPLRPLLVDQLTATTRRLVGAGGALPRWPGLG